MKKPNCNYYTSVFTFINKGLHLKILIKDNTFVEIIFYLKLTDFVILCISIVGGKAIIAYKMAHLNKFFYYHGISKNLWKTVQTETEERQWFLFILFCDVYMFMD